MATKKKAGKKSRNYITEKREHRKAIRDALYILEDSGVIDPFARRDARELLRGFISRTK